VRNFNRILLENPDNTTLWTKLKPAQNLLTRS
jgi:hypothetical protein